MNELNIALTGTAAFFCFFCVFLWWAHRRSKLDSVWIDGEFIYVGSPRKAEKLACTDIIEIFIAPLYDVAPADDCWLLQGKNVLTQ
ncbi:hypothetical protein KDH83_31295 [Achromobacter sp. Marseille-Q0513]|uniref:hypothetical protein n=1 Tax=Achromobacter sp. Marseille-Q0513 TaxID=2829161 RepID=UPI001B988BA4|nr:hypothetical protein [Achromobacter sp. Marseille-Q0513]MBR8657805.1 hypothetical protein [Achromobacter sp. Marseille-Q0513]